jgi:hypothetical protein
MNIIIDPVKITNYLLVPKDKNDKSKFLNELGYTLDNWEELSNDIQNIVIENEAVFQKNTPFGGDLYEVKGQLRNFGIITIWLVLDNQKTFRFVTLFPNKSEK